MQTDRPTDTVHVVLCVQLLFFPRQTAGETALVMSRFTRWFHFDPQARHVGHFDSKLDTRDQSSPIMTLLPRAKQLVH